MPEALAGVIEYADIPNQIYRQKRESVSEFNLMLVGTVGVGKSTLVKSLFMNQIEPEEASGTAKLIVYEKLLEEFGMKALIRCIETSNYKNHDPVKYTKYITDQLGAYFKGRIERTDWKTRDTRVHCCLYLIPPYGKLRLDKDDIDCMRALHQTVNLVPVIVKADLLNPQQLAKFKENILRDLEANEIDYYKFHFSEKEDEDRARAVKVLAERFPFALVAADESLFENKKKQWLRTTLGGQIDIRDPEKCDFQPFASLLIRHCLVNLKVDTIERHYSRFKARLLNQARMHDSQNLISLGLELDDVTQIMYDICPDRRKGRGSVYVRSARQVGELEYLRLKRDLLSAQLKDCGME